MNGAAHQGDTLPGRGLWGLFPLGRVSPQGDLGNTPLMENVTGSTLVQAPKLHCCCHLQRCPEGLHSRLHRRGHSRRVARSGDNLHVPALFQHCTVLRCIPIGPGPTAGPPAACSLLRPSQSPRG